MPTQTTIARNLRAWRKATIAAACLPKNSKTEVSWDYRVSEEASGDEQMNWADALKVICVGDALDVHFYDARGDELITCVTCEVGADGTVRA